MQKTERYLFAEMLTVADIPSITGQALQGRTLLEFSSLSFCFSFTISFTVTNLQAMICCWNTVSGRKGSPADAPHTPTPSRSPRGIIVGWSQSRHGALLCSWSKSSPLLPDLNVPVLRNRLQNWILDDWDGWGEKLHFYWAPWGLPASRTHPPKPVLQGVLRTCAHARVWLFPVVRYLGLFLPRLLGKGFSLPMDQSILLSYRSRTQGPSSKQASRQPPSLGPDTPSCDLWRVAPLPSQRSDPPRLWEWPVAMGVRRVQNGRPDVILLIFLCDSPLPPTHTHISWSGLGGLALLF